MTKPILSTLTALFIANSVNAQEYGLLLGFRHGGHYDTTVQVVEEEGPRLEGTDDFTQGTASYRTLWLRTQEGKLQLGSEKTSLLVSREDGFWRMDVKHSAYNEFAEDFIWINPPPDPDAPVNPFLATKEGIEAFETATLVKEQAIDAKHGESCIGHSYRDLLFVENNYVTVGFLNTETCQGMGETTSQSALQTLSIEELETVEFSELLGADAMSQLEKAGKNYKESRQGSDSQNWGELSGGVMRGQGQWVIKGHFPDNKGQYANFTTDLPVPEKLVKSNQLIPDWETIKAQIPDAVDALSSPDQSLLVVLTPDSLLSFTVENGKINSKSILHLTMKRPVTLVMAQWTEGQFVDNWSEEIDSLGPKPRQSWFAEAKSSDGPGKDNIPLLGIVATDPNVVLNVREGIGEHTPLLAKLDKDSKLRILDCLGQWYKIQLEEGKTGYVQIDYVKLLPKLPYVKAGCLAENCAYGKWKLKIPATLYESPTFESATLAQLEAQQTLQAMEGQVNTTQYGEIVVIKNTQIQALPIEAAAVENKELLQLSQSDLLLDLEPKGQGLHVVWYKGRLYYLDEAWDPQATSQADLWGKVATERKTDWWVKVELPDQNLQGWIANPSAENVR